MSDDDLRSLLETLDPLTRDALRRVLIHDQADRAAVASQLLRYRDGRGDEWADIIDMLTLHPETPAESATAARRDRARRATLGGRAGERRGTRPLFASNRDARPVSSPGYGAPRDAASCTGWPYEKLAPPDSGPPDRGDARCLAGWAVGR